MNPIGHQLNFKPLPLDDICNQILVKYQLLLMTTLTSDIPHQKSVKRRHQLCAHRTISIDRKWSVISNSSMLVFFIILFWFEKKMLVKHADCQWMLMVNPLLQNQYVNIDSDASKEEILSWITKNGRQLKRWMNLQDHSMLPGQISTNIYVNWPKAPLRNVSASKESALARQKKSFLSRIVTGDKSGFIMAIHRLNDTIVANWSSSVFLWQWIINWWKLKCLM